MTIFISFFTKLIIPDWPSTARFLTTEDKAMTHSRLRQDGGLARMDTLNRKSLRLCLTDWKIWMGYRHFPQRQHITWLTILRALIYFSITISGYSTALFIPTILSEFGYSASQAQVHSIPVWIVAAVVTISVGFVSDRMQHRYGFVLFGCIMASVGYIVLLCQGGLTIGAKYTVVFIVNAGVYIVQPITIVWLANNMGGHYKRAFGSAIQISFGNIGGIVASNIFVTNQAPRSKTGYAVTLAFMIVCAMLSTAFLLLLDRENKKRDRGERNSRLELPREELDNIGDDHPDFRFSK